MRHCDLKLCVNSNSNSELTPANLVNKISYYTSSYLHFKIKCINYVYSTVCAQAQVGMCSAPSPTAAPPSTAVPSAAVSSILLLHYRLLRLAPLPTGAVLGA
jgi:hypothetical protein